MQNSTENYFELVEIKEDGRSVFLPKWHLYFLSEQAIFDLHKEHIVKIIKNDNEYLGKALLYHESFFSIRFTKNETDNTILLFSRLNKMEFNFNFLYTKELCLQLAKDNYTIKKGNIFSHIGQSFIHSVIHNKALVKSLLEFKTDPFIKNEIKKYFFTLEEYVLVRHSFLKTIGSSTSSLEDEYKNSLKDLKLDNLNLIELAHKKKLNSILTLLKEMNFIQNQSQLKPVNEITFKEILEGLNTKDTAILTNLVEYRDILLKEKPYGKNILFYAIERGNMDWIKKIIEHQLVDKHDVNHYQQSAFYHSIARNKPRIAHYLFQQNWISSSDYIEKNTIALFGLVLMKMPKIAALLEIWGGFEIKLENIGENFGYVEREMAQKYYSASEYQTIRKEEEVRYNKESLEKSLPLKKGQKKKIKI